MFKHGKFFYDPTLMTKPAFQQPSVEEQQALRNHMDALFNAMESYKTSKVLDPVTQELFRDLGGTISNFTK